MAAPLRLRPIRSGLCAGLLLALASRALAAVPAAAPAVVAPGPALPWSQPGFFPLAVWLQDPAHAADYRAAGFNTYVGLWEGPTEAQLAALRTSGLYVICEQNEVARRHLADPSIIAWMHGDEPDNAQALAGGGYGPPVPAAEIVTGYRRLKSADPARPVLLNLGQGVAWDNWVGRGERSHHPEDYPAYLAGCDIASFDIYPVAHAEPEVAGNLWFVARGVERLRQWARPDQPVWNCLECTRIGDVPRKPTPAEVRAEAWQALIAGSRGLIYFVHQFKPGFREAALLDDPEMLAAVTALNREITTLAPVLNDPAVPARVAAASANSAVPVALLARRHAGAVYLFAAATRAGRTEVTFTLAGGAENATVEVIGENRTLATSAGAFTDRFGPWDVHLYRVSAAASAPP